MRGVLIHGVLLVAMVLYGYRAWTTEEVAATASTGSVVLWNHGEADLSRIEFQTGKKTVLLERKGDGAGSYWWGKETKIETKRVPKPVTPPAAAGSGSAAVGSAAAGSGSSAAGSAKSPGPAKSPEAGSAAAGSGGGSAAGAGGGAVSGAGGGGAAGSAAGSAAGGATGSAAGSATASAAGSAAGSGAGSAAAEPPVPEETVTTEREFPLGDEAQKLITDLARGRALRGLGKLTDEQKKDYKLDDTSTTLSVVFRAGTRSFTVGGKVSGGTERYVYDTDSGEGYVLAGSMIQPLDSGETSLRLTEPLGFKADAIGKVEIAGGGKARSGVRQSSTDDKGTAKKTWADAATGKPDQTLANFVDNATALRPTKYEAKLEAKDLVTVVTLTYADAKGARLGSLTLFKREVPGTDGGAAKTEYFVQTDRTRVPGAVPESTASRVENDLQTL